MDKDEYLNTIVKQYKFPFVFRRCTKEVGDIMNPVLPKDALVAEVKSYTDFSDPKWKLGDGVTPYKELPYCSGPPKVVLEMEY